MGWPMIIGGLLGAGASLIGSNKAAKAQTQAADQKIEFAREINDQNVARFEPYAQVGQNALSQYSNFLQADNPFESRYFNNLLTRGMDQIDARTMANGNYNSGARRVALDDYRMDTVGRFQDNYLNRLAGLSQLGQASAGMQANQGNIMGQNIGNALSAKGNALAANYTNFSNTLNDTIGNGLSAYAYMQGAG